MIANVGEPPDEPEPRHAAMPQESLIRRAAQVLGANDRVLGVWLAGSFGRGTPDPFSDVDLWVVVDPGQVDAFCQDWPALCDEIAPTVLRQQIASRPVFNQVTPDWTRFDLSVGTPDDLTDRTTSTVKALYDPTGLSAGLRPPAPARQPDPIRVQALGREFLRVLGLLPVVVGRQEYLVAQSGAGLLRSMLIELMLQDVAVEDRGGALHLNRLLPTERQQILTDLPLVAADRESAIAGHLACAAAFLPLARQLHERCGIDWPQELEDAARRHLDDTLGVQLPA